MKENQMNQVNTTEIINLLRRALAQHQVKPYVRSGWDPMKDTQIIEINQGILWDIEQAISILESHEIVPNWLDLDLSIFGEQE